MCTFSEMKTPYIIWSADRTQKTIILLDDDDEALYNNLILKGENHQHSIIFHFQFLIER